MKQLRVKLVMCLETISIELYVYENVISYIHQMKACLWGIFFIDIMALDTRQLFHTYIIILSN